MNKRKTIKQCVILLIALSAMSLSMSGCDGSNKNSSEETKNSSTSSTLAASVYEETVTTTEVETTEEETTEVNDTLEGLGIDPIIKTESGIAIPIYDLENINNSVEDCLISEHSEINGRAITYNDVIVYDCYIHDTDYPYCEAVAIADVYSEGGEYPDGEYYYAFYLTIKCRGVTSDGIAVWQESKVAIDNLKFVEKSKAIIARNPDTNSISLNVKDEDE